MAEVRVELGFVGGGGVSVTLEQAQWEQLQTALDKGDGGWISLPEKGGDELLVAVDKVIYARIHQLSRTVGFAH